MQDAVTQKVDNTEKHKQLVYTVFVQYANREYIDIMTLTRLLGQYMSIGQILTILRILEKESLIQSVLGGWVLMTPHDIVQAKKNKKRR